MKRTLKLIKRAAWILGLTLAAVWSMGCAHHHHALRGRHGCLQPVRSPCPPMVIHHVTPPPKDDPVEDEAPPPPHVDVAVSELIRHPALSDFPVSIQVEAGDENAAGMGLLRKVLEERLLARGVRVVPRGDAVVHVWIRATTHKLMDLGAKRVLMAGSAEVTATWAGSGELLLSTAFEAKSGANEREPDARNRVVRTLAARTAAAGLARLEQHKAGIRIRTVDLATDEAALPLDESVASLVQALGREPGVLGAWASGTGKGDVSGRGPSARVTVWLGPVFDQGLAEVVESLLAGTPFALERTYAIALTK